MRLRAHSAFAPITTTQHTHTTARATLRMIACASCSRQCADARCALAGTHGAAKATRKQQAAGKQAAPTQARCTYAEVGVERTDVAEGRICDVLPRVEWRRVAGEKGQTR